MDEILNNPLFDAFADASDSVYIYVTDMKTGHTRWSQNAIDFFDIGNSVRLILNANY